MARKFTKGITIKFISCYLILSLSASLLSAQTDISQSEIHPAVQVSWQSAKHDYARSKDPYDLMRVRMAEYYGLLLNKNFKKAYDYCVPLYKSNYNIDEYRDLKQQEISNFIKPNEYLTFAFAQISTISSEDFPKSYVTYSILVAQNTSSKYSIACRGIVDYWVLNENRWQVIPGYHNPLIQDLRIKLISSSALKSDPSEIKKEKNDKTREGSDGE